MNTDITDNKVESAAPGWILYDGHCPLCRRLAQRARPLLEPRGFRFAPLQRQWAAARLGLVQGESPGEMVVLTRDGQVIGGADALIHLAKQVGWAKPLGWLAGVPAFRAMLRAGYRWVARHRHCSVGWRRFGTRAACRWVP